MNTPRSAGGISSLVVVNTPRFVAALLIYSLATISFDERNTDPLTLRRIFNECNKILLDECSTGDQTIVEGLRIFLDQISSKQ